MMRTARQGCITPALGRNVLLAGKPRPETKLHPAVASAEYRPRGPTSPFLKRGQLTGPASRHEPAPPPRRSGGGSNGCSTQATAHLRATPPPRRGNSATPGETTPYTRFDNSSSRIAQALNRLQTTPALGPPRQTGLARQAPRAPPTGRIAQGGGWPRRIRPETGRADLFRSGLPHRWVRQASSLLLSSLLFDFMVIRAPHSFQTADYVACRA